MCVYVHIKFQVSSIILTIFRQGWGWGWGWGGGVGRRVIPPLPPQNEPLKSPPILGLRKFRAKKLFSKSMNVFLRQNNLPAVTCSKLTIETPEQGVKYVES